MSNLNRRIPVKKNRRWLRRLLLLPFVLEIQEHHTRFGQRTGCRQHGGRCGQ